MGSSSVTPTSTGAGGNTLPTNTVSGAVGGGLKSGMWIALLGAMVAGWGLV
jgi:hypothetical protein